MHGTREISHPCVLTQSYDPVNFKYSETLSIAQINLSRGIKTVLSGLLIQGFYFKTLNAIDTPVSLCVAVGSVNLTDYLKKKHNPGVVALQVDNKTGIFETYSPGVNDEKMEISLSDINPYRPHKFAFYNIAEASYDQNSALDIIKQLRVKETFLAQGTTYDLGKGEIEIDEQAKFLYLIPFIAGLKKTEIACSFRVRLTLREV